MNTTTTTHTPGPWKVDGGCGKNDERYVWTDRDEKGKGYLGTHEVCVCEVKGRRFNEGQDCTREEILLADAQLIAAAPALLAILRRIINRATRPMSDGDILLSDVAAAQAAIAQAEGRHHAS